MKKAYKYENVQIGTFLISMGYYLNTLKVPCPSINLLQQTPKNDSIIGDLFGALEGKYFIVEFKSDKKLLKNELTKEQRVELINRLKHNYTSLYLSLKGHLICYPDKIDDYWDFHIEPYMVVSGEKNYMRYKIVGIKNFVDELLKNNGSVGCDFNQIKAYIDLLKLCSNQGSYSVSGIIVGYSKKGFLYYEFDDLDILRQKLAIEKDISLGIEFNFDQSHKNDRGLSL